MPITSGAWIIWMGRFAGAPWASISERNSPSTPNNKISSSSCADCAARIAPSTTAEGARSPPIASTARRIAIQVCVLLLRIERIKPVPASFRLRPQRRRKIRMRSDENRYARPLFSARQTSPSERRAYEMAGVQAFAHPFVQVPEECSPVFEYLQARLENVCRKCSARASRPRFQPGYPVTQPPEQINTRTSARFRSVLSSRRPYDRGSDRSSGKPGEAAAALRSSGIPS